MVARAVEPDNCANAVQTLKPTIDSSADTTSRHRMPAGPCND